jgi:hypothetical protein
VQAELVTSSGRRVRKKILDEPDIATVSRPRRSRKSRNGHSSKRKRSPKSRGLRPQRRAARNALNFFSKIGASTEEDEDDSEGSFSDSELNTDSTDAEQLERTGQLRFSTEEDATQPSQFTDNKGNSGTGRKIVLRIPRRDLKNQFPSGSGKAECSTQDKTMNSLALANHGSVEPELTVEHRHSSACKAELPADGGLYDGSAVHSNNSIRWGEVKMRSSKRFKYSDPAGGLWSTPNNAASQDIEGSGSHEMPHEYGGGIQQSVGRNVQEIRPGIILDNIQENHTTDEYNGENFGDKEKITNDNNAWADGVNNTIQVNNTSQPSLKLKFKSRGFADGASLPDKSRSAAEGNIMNAEHGESSVRHDDDSSINQPRNVHILNVSKSSQECTDKSIGLHDSKKLILDSPKTFPAVYKRSKPNNRKKIDSDEYANEDSTSISNDDGGYQPPEYSPVTAARGRLRRSTRKSYAHNGDGIPRDDISQVKDSYSSYKASTSGRRIVTDVREVMWQPTSKTVGLRSARNKRESSNFPDTHLFGKKHQGALKYSWLMLHEHEDSYRYIPQLGDEVIYLWQVMLFFIFIM